MVQHFIGRYSRYSRYRTKTHDKATISHVFPRYSRYQTVFLKLEEISSYFCEFYKQKALLWQGFLCFIFTRIIAKDFGNRTPSVILSEGEVATQPNRVEVLRVEDAHFATCCKKSAPQQAKPQAMTPGTVLCDVSAGHVTEGLYPVSWRRGICAGF